jgi:hypothetical protein
MKDLFGRIFVNIFQILKLMTCYMMVFIIRLELKTGNSTPFVELIEKNNQLILKMNQLTKSLKEVKD